MLSRNKALETHIETMKAKYDALDSGSFTVIKALDAKNEMLEARQEEMKVRLEDERLSLQTEVSSVS